MKDVSLKKNFFGQDDSDLDKLRQAGKYTF
jgi:hypothetical protein